MIYGKFEHFKRYIAVIYGKFAPFKKYISFLLLNGDITEGGICKGISVRSNGGPEGESGPSRVGARAAFDKNRLGGKM